MTSKISFYKLFKTVMKDRLWGIAISITALFFALPIYAAAYIANISYQFSDGSKNYLFHRLFRYNVLCENNSAVMIFIPVLAAFLAINSFSYLFTKSKCDLYHALPLKRKDLFLANYASGIVSFVIPFIALDILAMIIGAVRGFVIAEDIPIAVASIILKSIGFIFLYTIAVLAIMITGNMYVSILGMVVFFCYSVTIEGTIGVYKNAFFSTYYTGIAENQLKYLSPIHIYGNLISQNSFTKAPVIDIVLLLITVVLTALIAFAGIVIYNKRPIEGAGTSIVFKKIRPYLSVVLLVPASLLGAMFFSSIASSGSAYGNGQGIAFYGWMIFGMIITIIVGHFIIQAIYYGDIKSLIKNPVNAVVALGISGIIASIFVFDITGFDSYVPKNDVESVAITSYAWQNAQDCYDFDADENESGYRNYWYDTDVYRLENMKITDPAVYLPFIEKCKVLNTEYNDFLASDDEMEDQAYCYIVVRYNKKNGKAIYRSFNVDMNKLFDEYTKVYADESYKKTVYTILSDDTDSNNDEFYYQDPLGETLLYSDNSSKRKELIDTYKEELREMDAETLRKEVPVARMYFKKIIKQEGYNDYYEYNIGYIYPSFTKTIELLNKVNDIDVFRYKNVDNIESIIYTQYHYDTADEDPTVYEFYSDEEIKNVLDKTVPYDFSTSDEVFHPIDSADIVVTYEKAAVGNTKTINLALLKGTKICD